MESAPACLKHFLTMFSVNYTIIKKSGEGIMATTARAGAVTPIS